MKLIKPVDLQFTSNIPEPDAAQGEAVWQSSDSTTNPFDATVKSSAYNSISNDGYISEDVNALSRKYKAYTGAFQVNAERVPYYGATSVLNGSLGTPTQAYDSAYFDGVLLAVRDDDYIYRSDDGGVTWSSILVTFANGEKATKVVFNENTGDAFCSAWGEVLISTDSGLTWTQSVSDNGEIGYSSPLIFDGTYISLIGSYNCRRFLNGSWSDHSNVIGIESIRFASVDNGDIYIITFVSNEIHKSSNGGATFTYTGYFFDSPVQLTCFHVLNGFAYITKSRDPYNVYFIDLSDGTQSSRSNGLLSGACFYAVSYDDYMILSYSDGCVARVKSDELTRIELASELLRHPALAEGGVVFLGDSSGQCHFLPCESNKITSAYNNVDNSMQDLISCSPFELSGSEHVQVSRYASLFSVPILSKTVELKSTPFANPEFGQCCADSRFIYQLIKDGGNWFVYKIDTLSNNVVSEDLGAVNSGYIDNFDSSNPAIFIDSNGINIPINKALVIGKFDAVLRLDNTPAVVTEVTPNALLTANCSAAIYTGGDTVTWFLENNTVEITDATNYDSLGGYREGDEVVSLSTHKRYRATTNTLDTPEAGSQKTPPTWTDIAPTNKYAALSTYIHNKTIASNGNIIYTFDLTGAQNSVCFFGMLDCVEINIKASDSGGEIYNEDFLLVDSAALDITGELTYLSDLCVVNAFGGATSVTVEISGGDNQPQIGRIFVGNAIELGVSQYGASLSIEDFSRRERNELGEFTVIPRDTAKNINFDVKINKEDVNFVFNYLSKLTTTPCVWLGDDRDSALQVYGFYSDYTHNIDYPSITSATISVEGLT